MLEESSQELEKTIGEMQEKFESVDSEGERKYKLQTLFRLTFISILLFCISR